MRDDALRGKRQLSPGVGAALRACLAVGDMTVSDEALQAWMAKTDPAELAAGAHFHGISGYVHQRLTRIGGTQARASLETLQPSYQGAIRSHILALAALQEVRRALLPLGVTWLVLKGPALAVAVHGAPDLRAYSDLDVLVPPRQLAAAVRALEGAGFETLDRNWVLLRRELKGELHAMSPHSMVVDLHWSVVNQRPTREALNVTTEELIAGAEPLLIDGQEVLTLNPVDTLLHLALHTVRSGGHRLLWFKDVERLLARKTVDWDRLVLRARTTRLGPMVAIVLRQAGRLLGAQVPKGLLPRLDAPRSWQQLAALAYRLAPPERAFGYGSVARSVSRATRPTLTASVRDVARRGSAWAGSRGDAPSRDGSRFTTADEPGAMQYASGTVADRAAFFEQVARQQ